MLNVVFIGCVQSSEVFLRHLISLPNAKVIGIVTREFSSNSDFVSLNEIAKINKIPNLNADQFETCQIANWIKTLNPDVIYCFGWSTLLKKDILQSARLGVIGYHGTLLPENRGRHPLIWSLVLGLEETASTFFFMDEGADSGDIINQTKISIDAQDDAGTLYQKLLATGKKQITEITNALNTGKYVRIPQDHNMATYWRKRSSVDGQIDWRMSAYSINNLVRALASPYPGAHCIYLGKERKIWKTENLEFLKKNIEPGKVLEVDGHHILVKCGDAAIKLIEHELKPLPEVGSYL